MACAPDSRSQGWHCCCCDGHPWAVLAPLSCKVLAPSFGCNPESIGTWGAIRPSACDHMHRLTVGYLGYPTRSLFRLFNPTGPLVRVCLWQHAARFGSQPLPPPCGNHPAPCIASAQGKVYEQFCAKAVMSLTANEGDFLFFPAVFGNLKAQLTSLKDPCMEFSDEAPLDILRNMASSPGLPDDHPAFGVADMEEIPRRTLLAYMQRLDAMQISAAKAYLACKDAAGLGSEPGKVFSAHLENCVDQFFRADAALTTMKPALSEPIFCCTTFTEFQKAFLKEEAQDAADDAEAKDLQNPIEQQIFEMFATRAAVFKQFSGARGAYLSKRNPRCVPRHPRATSRDLPARVALVGFCAGLWGV